MAHRSSSTNSVDVIVFSSLFKKSTMDVLGVNPMMKNNQKQQGKRSRKGIKVVYISSPMKVKTSASEFRALVQELTGRDSDAVGLMEANNASDDTIINTPPPTHHHKVVDDDDDHDHQLIKGVGHHHHHLNHDHEFPFSNSSLYDQLPKSPGDQLFQSFDRDDHFNQLDVLRSFDFRM